MSDVITIRGNIGTEPEQKLIGDGVPVTTFRVGSSQRRFDRAKGAWVEGGTNWFSVSAFRALGEHALASLHVGERVIVTGKLRVRHWENGGKRGTSVEIDADGIGHDLLWGTSRFFKSGEERTADTPAATGASAWATVQPGQGSGPTPDSTLRPGDWGAPSSRPGDWGAPTGAPAAHAVSSDDGTDGEKSDASATTAAVRGAEKDLQETPF